MATNLHADTMEQAQDQVCGDNAVPISDFRRMNLLFFLSVEHTGRSVRRRIVSAWESDGEHAHRALFGPEAIAPLASKLVSPAAIEGAGRNIDAIVQSGACTIEQVRAGGVNIEPRGNCE